MDKKQDQSRSVPFGELGNLFPRPCRQKGPWLVAMVVNTAGNGKMRNRLMIAESHLSLMEHLNKKSSVCSRGARGYRKPDTAQDTGGEERDMLNDEERETLHRTKTSGYWANVISVAGFEQWELAVAYLFLWHNRTRGVNSRISQVFGMRDQFSKTHRLVLHYYNKTLMEHVNKAVLDISTARSIESGERKFSLEKVHKLLDIILGERFTLGDLRLFNEVRKKRHPPPAKEKRRRIEGK